MTNKDMSSDTNETIDAIQKLIITKEAEAYKKGWAERGDYELRKYENVKD